MSYVLKFTCAAAFVLASSVSSYAADDHTQVLTSWYQALSLDVNSQAISSILAPDAVIDLKDLGIVQTKDEFVESLSSWEDAIEDGSIAFKLDEAMTSDQMVTSLVCYTFASGSSGQMMTKEIFEFENNQITKSVQPTLSDTCEGF
jgi:hypothetical protein